MNFSCHLCVSFIAGAVTLRLTLIICHAAQFPQYRFPFFLNHRHYKIIMFLFDHQSQSDVSFLNSLQVQVHQKRTKDQIQGCTEAGDQTQTPILPREDDIVSDTLFCLFQFFSFSSSFLSAARYLSCKSISALSLLYLFFLSFLLSLLSPFSFSSFACLFSFPYYFPWPFPSVCLPSCFSWFSCFLSFLVHPTSPFLLSPCAGIHYNS